MIDNWSGKLYIRFLSIISFLWVITFSASTIRLRVIVNYSCIVAANYLSSSKHFLENEHVLSYNVTKCILSFVVVVLDVRTNLLTVLTAKKGKYKWWTWNQTCEIAESWLLPNNNMSYYTFFFISHEPLEAFMWKNKITNVYSTMT